MKDLYTEKSPLLPRRSVWQWHCAGLTIPGDTGGNASDTMDKEMVLTSLSEPKELSPALR
jgi:hypothetical protein